MWSSTIISYKVLWRCHRGLTPKYRQLIAEAAASKQVHHIKSPSEIKAFLAQIEREVASG
jgi:hypothetical protein